MKINDLANALRERLRLQGLVREEILERVSDLDVIDSYVTCSCCGRKSVQPDKLEDTVQLAETVDQWLDMTSTRQLH